MKLEEIVAIFIQFNIFSLSILTLKRVVKLHTFEGQKNRPRALPESDTIFNVNARRRIEIRLVNYKLMVA